MALPAPSHTGAIEADSDIIDEGYATSIDESYLSTIPSRIRRGVVENGRLYPSLDRDLAAFTPIDEAEVWLLRPAIKRNTDEFAQSERNDWQHYKFFILLNDQLHLSPLADTPTDILDLGTGTGVWCIDMADKYPSATVIGVDLGNEFSLVESGG
jgi:2-polyprenyl-3-methyl-5-hydroxy-6-metoxy-1,4-benzoquinol methylase